jgi:hypothetical protein
MGELRSDRIDAEQKVVASVGPRRRPARVQLPSVSLAATAHVTFCRASRPAAGRFTATERNILERICTQMENLAATIEANRELFERALTRGQFEAHERTP